MRAFPTPTPQTSLPLYGHQPTRSDVYCAYWVPKQGAAATTTIITTREKKYEIKQTPIEPLVASLTRPLSSRLGQAVDVLVFNPPYVPTSDDEADAAQHGAGIAGSWAGGADGMQVTDTLLRQVDVRVCLFFCFTGVLRSHAHTITLTSRNL